MFQVNPILHLLLSNQKLKSMKIIFYPFQEKETFSMNKLELPQTRRSHARAISSPPPNAAPSMTAMVGTGSACIK